MDILEKIFESELSPKGTIPKSKFDGLHLIKDCIDYDGGWTNWHEDREETFDAFISVDNPDFIWFLNLLAESGYGYLGETEKATIFIIKESMIDDIINVGPADCFGKVAFNSWVNALNQQTFKRQRRDRLKLKSEGVDLPNLSRGPKGTPYFDLYASWLQRILPWYMEIINSGIRKDALVLLGITLCAGGFNELRDQYEAQPRTVKVHHQDGTREFVIISFKDYLHSRMKAVYTRLAKDKKSPM